MNLPCGDELTWLANLAHKAPDTMSQEPQTDDADNAAMTIKDNLTEEMFDLLVTRPLAVRVVQVLIPTPISANQVTAVGAVLGILAGFLIAQGTAAACGWAAAGLLACMILDCADGQLARARGGGSHFGRLLDGSSDYAVAIALHLGMLANLANEGVLFRNYLVDGWGLFAWILLAGFSMILHAGIFDYRKRWFLAHLRAQQSDHNSLEELKQEVREFDNIFVKAFLAIYVFYNRFQKDLEQDAPAQESVEIKENSERIRFQQSCEGFLRAASFLGPTSHNVLILLATVASPFFPQAFWWYILTAVVPMNILFTAVILWGRRLDQTFDQAPSA
jgi:hypothetical protein